MSEIELQKEYMRVCRENLRPFEDWLVETQGYRENEAAIVVALVCRATFESASDGLDPDPVNILDRNIRRNPWYRLRSALRSYYTWLWHTDTNSKKRLHYQRQQARLEIARFEKVSVRPARITPPPIPQDDYKKLLRNVKRWCGKHYRRFPWIWPFLGIRLKLGWRWQEILDLSRKDMLYAVDRGNQYGTISVIRKQTKSQSIKTLVAPLKLIRKEVDQLLAWPLDWNYTLEIVPHPRKQVTPWMYAAKHCNAAYNEFMRDQLPKKFSKMPRRTIEIRLKDAMMIWILSQINNDLLALSQIVGTTMMWLKKKPQLLEVGS